MTLRSGLSFMARRWNEIALLIIFAGIVSFQLFVPPFVGMADNADFQKVTGVFCLGPRDGKPHYFAFFVPDLVFAPQYCQTLMPSSERLFTYIAVKLHGLFGGGQNFDIREVSVMKDLTFCAGFFALLASLRPLGRVYQTLLGLFALWIFTDVLYVAYLNSFYTDCAAFLGAFLAVPLAVIILTEPRRRCVPLLVLFTAAMLLFGLSKAQHGLTGWIGSILLLAAARQTSGLTRIVPVALGLSLGIGSAYSVLSAAEAIRGQALFNVVMLKLLPGSTAPAELGAELRLSPEEMKLSGKNVWSPGVPSLDFASFYRRVFPGLLRWYFFHPMQAIHWLYKDLETESPHLRFEGGGNFRLQDGTPPGALTLRFASWSTLNAAAIRHRPLLLPTWYLTVITAAIVLLSSRNVSSVFGLVCMPFAVAFIAIVEYSTSSLLDAAETGRHLFLFHALTDLSLVFAAATVIWWCRARTGSSPKGMKQ
jgi:hypothetical protein